MNKKKILFLITKSNWGGAQRYVFDLATSLPNDQYEVAVALGGDGVLSQKLQDANIPVHHISGLQRDISLRKELQAYKAMRTIIKQVQPDILHINSSKAGFIGALAGRSAHVKRIVFTAHGWAFNEDRSLAFKIFAGALHWLTIISAHTTIAVSHALKQQMRWPGARRSMSVVYNGRSPIPFLHKNEARAELVKCAPSLAPLQADFWSGTIGELHHVKRHDLMINTVATLKEKGLSLHHLIIGGGDLQDELQTLAASLGVANQIHFVGHVHEAARYLRALDIYVQPSRSESFGYTVVEAAQAGLPIIASRTGGIPEIINSEDVGTLVPPEDKTALVQAVKNMTLNHAHREHIAAGALERSTVFTLSHMVTNTIAVYEGSNSRT